MTAKSGWFLALLVASGITACIAWRWNDSKGDGQSTDPAPNESSKEQRAGTDKTDTEWLEHLRKLPAAERKKLLDGVVTKESYRPVTTVPTFIQVDGTILSAAMSEIVCLVRAESANAPAATIRWIVKDRSKVKMGDKLLELDDEPIRQRLKAQIALIAEAEKTLRQAAENVGLVEVKQSVHVQLAEIDQRLAKLSLKRYAGNDPQEKKDLQAALDLATKSLEQTRAERGIQEGKATQELQDKKAMLARAQAALRDLHEDLTTCQLYAPRDGQVVHAELLPKSRLTEGQKVLFVCDLEDLKMSARTDEKTKPDIALVRPGQLAYIRPKGRPFPSGSVVRSSVKQVDGAHVTEIEFAKEKTAVGEFAALMPDMPASATIVLDEKKLMVPLTAILGQGGEKYCYVLQDKELHERRVALGAVKEGQKQVEVLDGLKEGNRVLVDPQAAIKELIEVSRAKK